MNFDPLLTKQQLAAKLCVSVAFIDQRLSINKLTDEGKQLVDSGAMNLSNAYALSKLPPEEQNKHLDSAVNDKPPIFVPKMKERAKDLKDAKNKGQDAAEMVWKPVQHLQKVSDVKVEFETLVEGKPGNSRLQAILESQGVNLSGEALKAVQLTLAYMLHVDPVSSEEQRKKEEARKAAAKEKTEKAKAEREARKLEKEKAEQADLTKGF